MVASTVICVDEVMYARVMCRDSFTPIDSVAPAITNSVDADVSSLAIDYMQNFNQSKATYLNFDNFVEVIKKPFGANIPRDSIASSHEQEDLLRFDHFRR